MQKAIKGRKFLQEFEKQIKGAFLDKLVFSVNQPNREELNRIVKSEIKKVQGDYIAIQERILRDLTASENHKKLDSYISGSIYEFNLLISILHSMFLHKNMFSINFERNSNDVSNDIIINYRGRITYVKAYTTNSSIGYSQLFPFKRQGKRDTFSINRHFAFFIEGLKNDIRYFIMYTNAGLDLMKGQELKKGLSKDFYPLKFNSINIQKKKYKILRDCFCIDENGLYQFAQEKTTREKILSLLKLPSLQKGKEEERFFKENEKEIKEKFLDKLIFAVNQRNKTGLNNVIKDEIEKDNESNKVPYNYEQLHEIALRWLDYHKFDPITKGLLEKLLGDIENNMSSYQKIQNKGIKEIEFAKRMFSRVGTPAFNQFLDFLIHGEGKKYLKVLERQEIKLTNVSSILGRARTNAIRAFKNLYNLWFDAEGKKTQYLKTLEENRINLSNMSSILSKAGANAAETFKDLYDLWFDAEGNKTHYLKTLEEKGINLSNISSILSGAGVNAAEAFKDLCDLWFDAEGNKTQYLKTLEENKIKLFNISGILSGAGVNGVKLFTDLYSLWFNTKGCKTQYLKTLEENGIDLANISSILNGARANAVRVFKDLYDLWFDAEGNKTQYLKTLKENRIDSTGISGILSKTGANAVKAFKALYYLWFDAEGNKTQYLKTLEENEINLSNISSILHGSGTNAVKAFKDLYDLWFDTEGNKTRYLKTLEENGIKLSNISSILHGAGVNATEAFKYLYNLWFDAEGNKTQHLKTLEEKGINLSNISSILSGAGVNVAKAFKDLYDLWFDTEGNKTRYLKTLEENGIDLTNISSILSKSGANAAKAFKDSYNLWLDEQGNKKQYLKHFVEKKDERESFTMHNLSGILSGTGTNTTNAFEKLHNVFFNDDGERTRLLNDFYNAGFKPSNLSSLLCRAGIRAPSILERLHNVCFDEAGNKTQLLDDFCNAGFRPCDLCSILSGAANSLEDFYHFCFIERTKKYLNHFLNEKESFTLSQLCNILHGAEANICSALKDFYDVCFDEAGNKTQLLDDFHRAGFTSSDLSKILFMTGSNTSSILRNFHKSCFDKKHYLNHFLAEKELFTSKNLSKMLYRIGLNACPTFEKLHDLCFDKAGNRTKYLDNLIENNPPKKVFNILYEKVREVPVTFLHDTSLQQPNTNGIKENKIRKYR
ncbi:uncharacterized protein LOC143187534 [Calliopsis andreniformis]|uniref:uncharacterized protein LOC143187534 n=1 Tax=Calliopsis andreniformis TaxID=337506 RepID=UPI003FCC5D1E